MFNSKVVVRAGWGMYYDRGELYSYLSPGANTEHHNGRAVWNQSAATLCEHTVLSNNVSWSLSMPAPVLAQATIRLTSRGEYHQRMSAHGDPTLRSFPHLTAGAQLPKASQLYTAPHPSIWALMHGITSSPTR